MYESGWHPSKSAARNFAIMMSQIEKFCEDNEIQHTSNYETFYFTLYNKKYRVSSHSVDESNRLAKNEFGKTIDMKYCDFNNTKGIEHFTAGKLKIIEIYTELSMGYVLTRRGELACDKNGMPLFDAEIAKLYEKKMLKKSTGRDGLSK